MADPYAPNRPLVRLAPCDACGQQIEQGPGCFYHDCPKGPEWTPPRPYEPMINWRARAEAAEAIVREVRAAVQVPGAKDLPQAVRLLRKSESECAERAEVLRKQMAEVRAVAAEILSDDRSHGAPWLDRLSAALRVEGPAW